MHIIFFSTDSDVFTRPEVDVSHLDDTEGDIQGDITSSGSGKKMKPALLLKSLQLLNRSHNCPVFQQILYI